MKDNDIRLDKEPLPGETRGEMFLRIEDKSAPWECPRQGCGRPGSGERIAAAMRKNAQLLGWIYHEILPQVKHRGSHFEDGILRLCSEVMAGKKERADVLRAIGTAEVADRLTEVDVLSFLEVVSSD